MSVSTPLAGKTVLITGAGGGIGLETARALARMGAGVVLAPRDAVRGQIAADEIQRAGGRAELAPIDMGSFASIRATAERFLATHALLDVLVNNAGIVVRDRRVSPDGHELTWATNFLGAFLLTRLLLPALRRAPSPRIVNVSSEAHKAGRIDWDDLEMERHRYSGFGAYANSKLALLLFTRELARRETRVAINAVHPGVIATGIWRAAPAVARWILTLVLPSAEKGARPVVRLATAPELTGRYFDRMREAKPSPAASNDADAARLWDLAERLTGS